MTKKDAQAMARRRLQFGWFAEGCADARVRCPLCDSHDVTLYGSCGRRPAQAEMVRQLAQAVVDCWIDQAVEVTR